MEVAKQRSWEAHTAPEGYERVKLQDLPGRSRRPYEKKGVITISPQAQELNAFLKTKLVKEFSAPPKPNSVAHADQRSPRTPSPRAPSRSVLSPLRSTRSSQTPDVKSRYADIVKGSNRVRGISLTQKQLELTMGRTHRGHDVESVASDQSGDSVDRYDEYDFDDQGHLVMSQSAPHLPEIRAYESHNSSNEAREVPVKRATHVNEEITFNPKHHGASIAMRASYSGVQQTKSLLDHRRSKLAARQSVSMKRGTRRFSSRQSMLAPPKPVDVQAKRKTHADLKSMPLRSLERFTVSDLDPLDVIVRKVAREHKIPLNDAELILNEYKHYDSDGGGSIEYSEFSELIRALSTTTVSESSVKSYWNRLPKEEPNPGEVEALDLETFLPWYFKTFGTPKKDANPKSPKKKK